MLTELPNGCYCPPGKCEAPKPEWCRDHDKRDGGAWKPDHMAAQITGGESYPPMGEDKQAELKVALDKIWGKAQEHTFYAYRRKGQPNFCTCDQDRYNELAQKPKLFEVTIFYATPKPCPSCLHMNSLCEFNERTMTDLLGKVAEVKAQLIENTPLLEAASDALDARNDKIKELEADRDDWKSRYESNLSVNQMHSDNNAEMLKFNAKLLAKVAELKAQLLKNNPLLDEAADTLDARDARIKELEADRDTWKARAEFSFDERTKLEANIKTNDILLMEQGDKLAHYADRITWLEAELSKYRS